MGDVVVALVLFVILGSVPAIVALAILGPALAGSGAAGVQALAESVSEAGPVLVASLALSWCGLMIPTWLAAFRKGDGDWRALLRWRFDARRDLPIAIAFAVVARAAEAGVNAALSAFGVSLEGLGNTGYFGAVSGVWLVLLVVCAAVGAPVVEEIFFRGLFLSVAVRNYGTVAGVVVTSLVFGLMHAQASWAATAYTVSSTALIGAALAVLTLRTGRLGASISAHVLFNASGVALVLATT